MDKVMQDLQPGLGTSGIVGTLTVTKTGTTARTVTFPDAAITVAGINYAQTWTAAQTFTTGLILGDDATARTSAGFTIKNVGGTTVATFGAGSGTGTMLADGLTCAAINSTSASGITQIQAATQDGIAIKGRAGGTGSYIATLTPPTLSASITLTLPAVTGTLAILGANTFTGAQSFSEDINLTGGKYIYLRGDASSDGSVRLSSASSGTAQIEIRVSGSWVIQQLWGGS